MVTLAFVFLTTGLMLGAFVGWLWAASRNSNSSDAGTVNELRRQLAEQKQEAERIGSTLAREQQARVAAETRLVSAEQSFEEQRKLLHEAETRLRDTFKALSADALKGNNEAFAKHAGEQVKPLKDALEKYEAQIKALETSRQAAYAGMKQLVESIGAANQNLQKETTKLVTALRAPQVRGRWGELQLQRVVEAAGMSPHCDFDTQHHTETDSGRLRPDLVIHLPGDRTIVVDAKTPLSDFLTACEAPDDEARAVGLKHHAAAVRTQMQLLSAKEYWNQFEPSPDFVVMFLPGESFFSAALDQDRDLIEDGIAHRVILATPTTLIALLKSVAYAWQQRDVAENAEQIARTARDLFERLCTFAGDHMADVGSGLARAIDAYNKAVRSWETRVVPAGRRVAELGATRTNAEFPEMPFVDSQPFPSSPVTPRPNVLFPLAEESA